MAEKKINGRTIRYDRLPGDQGLDVLLRLLQMLGDGDTLLEAMLTADDGESDKLALIGLLKFAKNMNVPEVKGFILEMVRYCKIDGLDATPGIMDVSEILAVELKAGYRNGPIFTVFKGNIRDVTTTQEGADIKSEMECGDGDEGINKGAVSKTFPAGTKPKEIVEYLQKEMPGTTKGEMKGLDDLPAYKRPVSLYGWAFREMDKLGREHGFYWSVQNGQVEAVKNDQVLPSSVVLSKDNGLIEIPEVTDKGVKAKCLIRPDIAPGRQIDVRSDFLAEESGKEKSKSDEGGGLYRIAELSFDLTNRGQNFYYELEGNRVEGGKVVK